MPAATGTGTGRSTCCQPDAVSPTNGALASRMWLALACSASVETAPAESEGANFSANTPGLSILAGEHKAGALHAPGPSATDGKSLYVVDYQSANWQGVSKVDLSTGKTTLLVGGLTYNGSAFSRPTGIAAGSDGKLYVTDWERQTVVRVDPETGDLGRFAGSVFGDQEAPRDGVGEEAIIRFPGAIAADGSGHLFVTEESDPCTRSACTSVRKIDIATRAVTTLQVSDPLFEVRNPRFAGATNLKFEPGPIAVHEGRLYMVDRGTTTIRTFDLATRKLEVFVGALGGADAPRDGVGEAAAFTKPTSISSDGHGSLYVADTDVVRKIDIATKTVVSVAGTHRDESKLVDGHNLRNGNIDDAFWKPRDGEIGPLPGSFDCPADVTVLAKGKLAISEPCSRIVVMANGVK